MHKCLVAGRKTRGYTRYLPLFVSLFIVLPDRPLQSTFEPRSKRSPEEPSTTSSSPLTRSNLWFPGRRPRLFDRVVFVLALLRLPFILVSVLKYLCFR